MIVWTSFSIEKCFRSLVLKVLVKKATGLPDWFNVAAILLYEASISTVKETISLIKYTIAFSISAFRYSKAFSAVLGSEKLVACMRMSHFFRILGNPLKTIREHSQRTTKRINITRKGKFFKRSCTVAVPKRHLNPVVTAQW